MMIEEVEVTLVLKHKRPLTDELYEAYQVENGDRVALKAAIEKELSGLDDGVVEAYLCEAGVERVSVVVPN